MGNTFLVSVAEAIGFNPSTEEAIFYGKANLTSAFTLTMANTDVRGGINNPLLYKYMHDRDLEISIESATFDKTFLALNVGSTVLNETVNVIKTECVQLTAGEGTVTATPIGNVSVFKADGTIVTVTPVGTTITVPGGESTTVKVVYRYSDTVDRIAIQTTTPPTVITLILIAEVRDDTGAIIEYFQVEVPRLQIDGNYELTLAADGVSSQALKGMALAVSGATCSSGDIYAYVSWILNGGASISVSEIAANPSSVEVAIGDLPATQQLTVLGIRGGVYSNVTLDPADCDFTKLSGDVDITVGLNTGLIAIAGTADIGDSAIIQTEYDGKTDVTLVEVIA